MIEIKKEITKWRRIQKTEVISLLLLNMFIKLSCKVMDNFKIDILFQHSKINNV